MDRWVIAWIIFLVVFCIVGIVGGIYIKQRTDGEQARTDEAKSDLASRGFTIIDNVVFHSPSIEVTLNNETMFIQTATELNTTTIYQTFRGLWIFNDGLTIGYCWSP